MAYEYFDKSVYENTYNKLACDTISNDDLAILAAADTKITDYSKKFGDFLNVNYSGNGLTEEVAVFSNAIDKHTSVNNVLTTIINRYDGMESGSGVSSSGGSGDIDASGVGSENLNPVAESFTPTERSTVSSSPESYYQPREISNESYKASSVPSLASTSSNLGRTLASAGSALGAAATAAASKDVGGLGSASVLDNIDYPSGNYTVGGGFANKLTDGEKDSVSEILQEYGYTQEEIDAVLNGEFKTSEILVNRMSKELQDLVDSNPGIRDEILARYGFDIYTDTGEIDKDKLALALYLDDLDGQDEFSLISMLSKEYGVDLVDMDLMNNYSGRLEQLLLSNFDIKRLLKEKYGFDLFNPDGSINKDRLILAMLIDDETGTKILDIMNEAGVVDNTGLLSSVRNLEKASSIGVGLPIAALLTASGTAVAIGVAVHNNKKKKENEDDNEDDAEVDLLEGASIISKQKNDDEEKHEMSQWINEIINEA